jgi:hypothetical protein
VTLLTLSGPGQSCRHSDLLQVERFGFRTSLKERILCFPKPVPPQPHKMRTAALSAGKRQRRGIDHPPPSSAKVNTKQSYNSTPLHVLHCMLQEEFIFTYVCIHVYCTNTVIFSITLCFLPLRCVFFCCGVKELHEVNNIKKDTPNSPSPSYF